MMKRIGVKAVAALTCALLGAAVPANADTVEILATGILTFDPPDVVITVGDSVHWTGLGGGFHTVAEADDAEALVGNGGFHSPAAASEFTETFNTAGLFHYLCEPHVLSDMRGTITVEEAGVPTVSTWGVAMLVLFVLVAGTVADRFERRRIVLVSDSILIFMPLILGGRIRNRQMRAQKRSGNPE